MKNRYKIVVIIIAIMIVGVSCHQKKESKKEFDAKYFHDKYLLLKKYDYNFLWGFAIKTRNIEYKIPEVYLFRHDSMAFNLAIRDKAYFIAFIGNDSISKNRICEHFNLPRDSAEYHIINKLKFIYDLDIKNIFLFNKIIEFQIDNNRNFIFYSDSIEELNKIKDIWGLIKIEGNWYYSTGLKLKY